MKNMTIWNTSGFLKLSILTLLLASKIQYQSGYCSQFHLLLKIITSTKIK